MTRKDQLIRFEKIAAKELDRRDAAAIAAMPLGAFSGLVAQKGRGWRTAGGFGDGYSAG